jgi:hypothetical protein
MTCESTIAPDNSGVVRKRPEHARSPRTSLGSRVGSNESPRQRCGRALFQLLKRERIRRRIYATRDEARQDIFDYIEMFYNPKRRHSFSNDMSRLSTKSSIFSGSRAARKAVAIHHACAARC